eukprot:Skav236451  [mRNA]  locus=scaffold1758:165443:166132:+ [translate_table: standard]
MFAGGVGGWSSGYTFLKQFGLHTQVVAIESDIKCVQSFAINHDAVVLNGYEPLNRSVLENIQGNVIIHADASSTFWVEAVSQWRPELVTISSPCIPWSRGGLSRGLHSPEGLLLPEAISICKMLRPKIILLEQVAGIGSHEHLRMVIKHAHWAGYVVKHAKIANVLAISPVQRSRWLAILVRAEDQEVSPQAFVWWECVEGLTPAKVEAIGGFPSITESSLTSMRKQDD